MSMLVQLQLHLQISGPTNKANLLLLTGGYDGSRAGSSAEVFPPTANCSSPSLPRNRFYHTTFLSVCIAILGTDATNYVCVALDFLCNLLLLYRLKTER